MTRAAASLPVLVTVGLSFWNYRVIELATQTRRATDLVKEHYPTAKVGFAALRDGRLALWNPDQLAGVPFLAVPYTGLLYPGNLAHWFLDTAIAIEVTQVGHLILGGLCMWLLVALLGVTRSSFAGLAAALTFMLSGWMVTQIHLPTLVQGMAYLPATMLAVEWRLRRGRFAVAALALVVALQVLNGSTEFLLYNLVAAAVWALFDLVPRASGGQVRGALADVGALSCATLLGLTLAGAQLLPTLELVMQSSRVGGVTLEEALFKGAIPPRLFLADSLAGAGAVAVGILPFLGVPLLVRSLFSRGSGREARRRVVGWYAVGLAAASLLLISGGPVYELYFESPVGSLFRRPNKLLHLYAFASALMAALAVAHLDTWREEAVSGRALWRRPGWLGALGVLVIVAVAGGPWHAHVLVALTALIVFGTWPGRGVRLAAIGLLVLAQGGDLFLDSPGRTGGSLDVRRAVRPSTGMASLHSERALFEALEQRLRDGGGRIYLSPGFKKDAGLTLKQGMLQGLPVVMDKQPLAMRRHGEFFDFAAGRRPAIAARGYSTLMPGGHWELLDLASTRFYVLKEREPFEARFAALALHPDESGVRLVEGTPGYRLYERSKASGRRRAGWLPRAYAVAREGARADGGRSPEDVLAILGSADFDPRSELLLSGAPRLSRDAPPDFAASVRITVDEPERVEIEVDADGDAYLVLADSFYPGWRATVEGRPVEILRANHLFRAVPVPPGPARVEFSYEPESLRWGALLSVGSGLMILGLGLWPRGGFGLEQRLAGPATNGEAR